MLPSEKTICITRERSLCHDFMLVQVQIFVKHNPMQRLSTSYKPEDSGHGELTATVQSGSFAGKASAWFSVEQLRKFAEMLGSFPIEPEQEPILHGGYSKDGQLYEEHLSIRIAPVGRRGKLQVQVALATPAPQPNPSETDSVKTSFSVNYGDLINFQQKFIAMLNNETSEAFLEPSSS